MTQLNWPCFLSDTFYTYTHVYKSSFPKCAVLVYTYIWYVCRYPLMSKNGACSQNIFCFNSFESIPKTSSQWWLYCKILQVELIGKERHQYFRAYQHMLFMELHWWPNWRCYCFHLPTPRKAERMFDAGIMYSRHEHTTCAKNS